MKKIGLHIFIFTVVLFGAGTSAVSYSLAKEVAQKKNALASVRANMPPWYCMPPGVVPDAPTEASSTQETIVNNETFLALASACPTASTPDWHVLNSTCDALLIAHLEHTALNADDAKKIQTCEKKFQPAVWNTSINKKICTALRTYKADCTAAQKNGLPCRSIDGYLVPAGAPLNQINGVAHDAALYCDALFQ